MPNVIYIQVISGYKDVTKIEEVPFVNKKGKREISVEERVIGSTPIIDETMVFPLFEDLKMDVGSTMSSFADMFHGISDMITKGSSYFAGATGTTTTMIQNLTNIFDVPRWQKTEAIKFTVSLPFFTITNAKNDVYKPMKKIMDLTILSQVGDGKSQTWSVPGFSAATINQALKGEETIGTASKYSNKSAKLVSIKIPGIIHLPLAIITNANPTWSKHIVDTGSGSPSPLWGKLDCVIQGIYPALSSDFNGGRL